MITSLHLNTDSYRDKSVCFQKSPHASGISIGSMFFPAVTGCRFHLRQAVFCFIVIFHLVCFLSAPLYVFAVIVPRGLFSSMQMHLLLRFCETVIVCCDGFIPRCCDMPFPVIGTLHTVWRSS